MSDNKLTDDAEYEKTAAMLAAEHDDLVRDAEWNLISGDDDGKRR